MPHAGSYRKGSTAESNPIKKAVEFESIKYKVWKMSGYQNIENEVLDILINKPDLLQLYLFLRRHRRVNDLTKPLGRQQITIKKGQLDIGTKQIGFALSVNPKTIESRLDTLEKLQLIFRKGFRNLTTVITVNDKQIQPPDKEGVQEPVQDIVRKTSGYLQDTNNIVLKNYSINNIYLSEQEHANLIGKYGSEDTEGIIKHLSNYKINNPKYKKKSDYLCMTSWVIHAYFEWKEKEKKFSNPIKKEYGNLTGKYGAFAQK